MVFSSLIFLCVFLPIVFILHSIIQINWMRNGLLILASLLFYAYGEPIYVVLLILSSAGNYTAALLIERFKYKKLILTLACVCNLGVLCVFKYTGFVIETVNQLINSRFPIPSIALPIGISFFTFQAMSYVIDVYSGKIIAQKNYAKVLLYISFFPQLIAGPVVKYRDINRDIDQRQVTANEAWGGFQRFVIGLGKKVLIANTMGSAADQIFSVSLAQVNIVVAWVGAIAYLFQIYYDFSGYSDMAIGLGRMFGFHFKENFQYPYGAVCIQDFWRRWHISLSEWFKEYLYIPLGGNRKGRIRTYLNRLIVFFCTGLWHGASWTFVLWGLYHGLLLILEDMVPVLQKLPKMLRHIYALIAVCIGFVMFRADTVGQGFYFIREMFTGFTFSSASMSFAIRQLTPWFLVILVSAIIGMAPIRAVSQKMNCVLSRPSVLLSKKWIIVQQIAYVLTLVLLFWCLIRLSANTYNPFIYFRF